MKFKKVYIIAGSTASGKSAYAENFIKEKKAIINSDSKQFYNIIPTLSDIPKNLEDHYMYGSYDYSEQINVMKWIRDLKNLLGNLDKQPVIVGGTGLYLKILTEGIIPIPEIENDPLLSSMSNEDLYAKCISLDDSFKFFIGDRFRMIRYLNIMISTGKSISWWHKQKRTKLIDDVEFYKIMISSDKEKTLQKAKKRIEFMFPRAIEEVIEAQRLQENMPHHIESIIGFREIRSYLNKEIGLDEVKDRMLVRTMQYAKRQRTWFRWQMTFDEVI
ncbi:tRNA (adenosine(37)-N6)-dimethylallyltransferase [Candidatus Nesciobacter abundans]|uniref:tRNA dimethylallyltransferase n=1 Tax=Candidatus Nesciobacter abundans TaxID=2601668 RepID=A0A5C0UK61_9PROT|nr:hypothetical protein [Candidatus Nesciobacter abundans]QEK39244.1 hypothetical protein FZC36_02305 [Candidatus Nesciobacter abundans]